MKMQVTGRHMQVTQVAKDYAEEKSKRLEKYADKINRRKVILSQGKNASYSADIIVSGRITARTQRRLNGGPRLRVLFGSNAGFPRQEVWVSGSGASCPT